MPSISISRVFLLSVVYSSFALDCFRCTGYSDDDECSSGGPELINSGESDIKKTCTDSDDVCFVSMAGVWLNTGVHFILFVTSHITALYTSSSIHPSLHILLHHDIDITTLNAARRPLYLSAQSAPPLFTNYGTSLCTFNCNTPQAIDTATNDLYFNW